LSPTVAAELELTASEEFEELSSPLTSAEESESGDSDSEGCVEESLLQLAQKKDAAAKQSRRHVLRMVIKAPFFQIYIKSKQIQPPEEFVMKKNRLLF
jgi:hypothetical protein